MGWTAFASMFWEGFRVCRFNRESVELNKQSHQFFPVFEFAMLAGWPVRIVECGAYKADNDQFELNAVEDDFDCEVGGCLLLRVYGHVTSFRSCSFR